MKNNDFCDCPQKWLMEENVVGRSDCKYGLHTPVCWSCLKPRTQKFTAEQIAKAFHKFQLDVFMLFYNFKQVYPNNVEIVEMGDKLTMLKTGKTLDEVVEHRKSVEKIIEKGEK